MKKFIFITLIFISNLALGGRPIMDSLAREVRKIEAKTPSFQRDTLLITAVWNYGYYSIYFHEKNAKLRLDSLENLTKKIKWKVGEGMFLINKSYYASYFDNDFSRGLEIALKAKEILEKTKNYEAIAFAQLRIASTLLWNVQNIVVNKNTFLIKGLKTSEDIYELGKKINNANIICLGLVYEANFQNVYEKYTYSIELLKNAEKLMQQNKVNYFAENLIYGMLSSTYRAVNDSKNALFYTEKAQDLAKKQQDFYSLLSIYRFKAEYFGVKGDIEKAQENFEKSYEYAKKFGVLKFISVAENYLYRINKFRNNKEKSLEYLELYKRHEDSLASEKTQKVYADYDLATKETKIQKLENQKLLTDKIEKEKEIQYLRVFKVKQDSLILQKNQKIQANFALANKENKIKTLENDKLQMENKRKDLTRNLLIISLLAGVGLIYYFFKNNQKLKSKNREIEGALFKGQTIERKRVAEELHDNLSAKISGIKWRLEAIQPKFEVEKQQKIYESSVIALAEVYTDVRLIAHNLLPAELETKGLKVALANLIKEINSLDKTKFSLEIQEEIGRFQSKIEYEIFSIILELSNNILKHSQAENATISLENKQKLLKLIVFDNGIGINNAKDKKGMGMENMKSRVNSLNGKLEIENQNGVKVEIVVPV